MLLKQCLTDDQKLVTKFLKTRSSNLESVGFSNTQLLKETIQLVTALQKDAPVGTMSFIRRRRTSSIAQPTTPERRVLSQSKLYYNLI